MSGMQMDAREVLQQLQARAAGLATEVERARGALADELQRTEDSILTVGEAGETA